MLTITDKNYIYITRGDIASLVASIKQKDGSLYLFTPGDIVRFTIVEKNNYDNVLLRKDVKIESESECAVIHLDKEDTRFCPIISKPVDYWYEIELNPETNPQTFIGYDKNGAKIFRIFPEGGQLK